MACRETSPARQRCVCNVYKVSPVIMGPITSHIFHQLLVLLAITPVRHVSETFLRNGCNSSWGGYTSIMLHKEVTPYSGFLGECRVGSGHRSDHAIGRKGNP